MPIRHRTTSAPHSTVYLSVWRWLCFAIPLIRKHSSTAPSKTHAFCSFAKRSNCGLTEKHAAGHNATCRIEVTLADGRKLSAGNTDMVETDQADTVEQRVEKKFFNLTSSLPGDRPAELLARLKAIEERNVAKLFSF